MTAKVLGISVLHRTMSTQSHNTYTTSFHGMNVHFGSIQRAYPIIIDYAQKGWQIEFLANLEITEIWWIPFVTISFIVK